MGKRSDLRNDITMCLTMGRRPQELRATAASLGPDLVRLPILAVNDFGDGATNAVFHELFPRGRIVPLPGHVGHMRALEALYAEVRTPYVFHFEDDWTFTRDDFLDESIAILKASPQVSQVCLRAAQDIKHARLVGRDLLTEVHAGVGTFRLDVLQDVWYRYTFNPHVARTADWKTIISLGVRGEKQVSRFMRRTSRYTAFLLDGACHHAGADNSVRKALEREQRQIAA